MSGLKYTVFLLMGFLFARDIMAQRPEPPVLHSVTIDPETGNTIITWLPSPTPAFVDYYYVEQQDEISGTIRVISPALNPSSTSYAITSDEPHMGSVAYTVVAVHDLGLGNQNPRSGWDTPDSTIFLNSVFDSCQAHISMDWNDYNTWRGSIDEYRIYRRLEAGIYDLQNTFPEGTNSFDLGDLQANQTYQIFIEALHEDGRTSRSNMVTIDARMMTVPAYINADFATIEDGNGIELSFTVGGTTGLSFYRLLRSNSFEGPYSPIDSLSSADSHITYTDEVDYNNGVYYYRLQVVNNCGIGSTISNSAVNILLNGSLTQFEVELEWNEYRNWLGNVDGYSIIRTIGRQNPETDTIGSTSSLLFSDDISNLVDYIDPAEGLVCYTIMANENTNQYGITGRSRSNQACFAITPGLKIPNAFIPNDTEPENQVFEPVFTFLPEHYEIIIYNRLGSKIWEGKGSWDGRVNGRYTPEGVYVYYIRVYNHAGEIKEYNGMVTVIYR